MNLCRDEDRPVWVETRMGTTNQEEKVDPDLIRELQEGQRRLSEELIQLRDLIGRMEK